MINDLGMVVYLHYTYTEAKAGEFKSGMRYMARTCLKREMKKGKKLKIKTKPNIAIINNKMHI